jgi:PAS domain S-box-containing protein
MTVIPQSRSEPMFETFLEGSGEIGALVRAIDWKTTPFGTRAHWPQSLRTTLSICLSSLFPIAVYWGPEYLMLYNQSLVPMVGPKKHPQALGQPAKIVLAEIWHIIEPLLRQVRATGEAIWSEDLMLPLARTGAPEESYFTFTYSPIRDESQGIGGVFCAVIETTDKVIEGRRLHLLNALAETRGAATPVDACIRAAETIQQFETDVPFALLYLQDQLGLCTLAASAHIDPGHPLAAPLVQPGDDSVWPLDKVKGEPLYIPLDSAPGGARGAVLLPMEASETGRPAGFVVAGLSPMLAQTTSYTRFHTLLASSISQGVSAAALFEQERRRAAALAELDRAKTAFFSNVSHEFRTPLTLMLGPAEDALASTEGLSAAERERWSLVHRNALRLSKLVNTLLDFSRIEAGRVAASYEPTDLSALTSDLASVFRSAMENAGLAFKVECDTLDELVYVDRGMWEKIVLNLLSNAFKFTLHGEVAVRLHRQDADAVLEVQDSGVGVPEHELPRLFERFHRVEGTVGRTLEGSGIGLALVQELVKLNGGTIHAVSKLGVGTTLFVRLPLGSAHLPAECVRPSRPLGATAVGAEPFVQEVLRWSGGATAEGPAQLPAIVERASFTLGGHFADTAGARIILADDNADMRDYIRDLLSPIYAVEAVTDGEQALEAAHRLAPDLVLSDIMMPRVDGFGLLRSLRADKKLRDIPVILLSARAGEEARIEGLEAGADDYMIKPFSARELMARVSGHLALHKARRDAMTALSEAERRIRELFRQAPGFMCILRGPEHTFEFANDSYRLLVGDRDLIGKSVREIIPEVEGQGYLELLDKVYRTGETITGTETSLQLQRGPKGTLESYFIDFVYQPIKDAAGTVSGIFVEGFDVTSRILAQRDLRRSEDLRQLALDASRMGTFTWDLEHDRSEPDARALELFGITASSTLTLDAVLTDLIDPQDRSRYAKAVARALDPSGNGALQEDILITRPNDGSKHWLALSGQAFFEGDPRRTVRMIVTATDITERKHVEEALRLADYQKDEFLAMLAHELRNPLAPISTAGALLSRTVNGDHRARFAIDTIKRQTRQLTRLVDDLLDVSRITRGRIVLQRQPIDLAAAIGQAVETVEPQLSEKEHRISVTTSNYPPLYVSGDLTRIVQCIVNVLANAAKYTDPGGEIRVRTRSEGSNAVIEVSDTGVGISAELLPRIFDLFVQGDRTLDRAQGGLGIGLSVVKRLVEMHDGEITARSAGLGRGSTFEIRLPRTARPQTLAPEGAGVTSPPRNVLIVDDNADAATTLAALLNSMGHETRTAFSGAEALEQLQTFEPEVVLLDIGLPAMNGYELAQRLRSNPKLKSGRLIALTGYGHTEDRQRALAEGFEEHLVKPVDVQTLERILSGSTKI